MKNFFIYAPDRSGSTLACAYISSNSNAFVLNDTFLFEIIYNTLNNEDHYSLKNKILTISPRIYDSLQKLKKKFLNNPIDSGEQNYSFKEINGLVELDNVSLDKNLRRNLLNYYRRINPISKKMAKWAEQYCAIYKNNYNPQYVVNNNEKVADVLNRVLCDLIPDKNQKIFSYLGEKTPSNIFYHNLNIKMFPEAKFIAFIRNPVSNISSLTKRMESLDSAIKFYKDFLALVQHLEDKGTVSVLRYEDLLYNRQKFVTDVNKILPIDLKKSEGFNYYIRNGYLGGNKFDPSRDAKNFQAINKEKRELIYKSTKNVFERYYSDFKEIYNIKD